MLIGVSTTPLSFPEGTYTPPTIVTAAATLSASGGAEAELDAIKVVAASLAASGSAEAELDTIVVAFATLSASGDATAIPDFELFGPVITVVQFVPRDIIVIARGI